MEQSRSEQRGETQTLAEFKGKISPEDSSDEKNVFIGIELWNRYFSHLRDDKNIQFNTWNFVVYFDMSRFIFCLNLLSIICKINLSLLGQSTSQLSIDSI